MLEHISEPVRRIVLSVTQRLDWEDTLVQVPEMVDQELTCTNCKTTDALAWVSPEPEIHYCLSCYLERS
jgi:hypothetical protein